MKKRLLTTVLGVLLIVSALPVRAGRIHPEDSCLNINGGIFGLAAGCLTSSEAAPDNVTDGIETEAGAIDTGLGSVGITLDEVGDFFVGLFTDWEIDEEINTFFNEDFGSGGTPADGQSFEVDEPGFGGGGYFGDIFFNFEDGVFDDTFLQDLVFGESGNAPEDISLGLGWDFSLAAGQTAVVNFLLSDTQPTSGFWLSHSDPLSEVTFFFSSTLDITGGETEPPVSVPEPGTLLLIGAGLVGTAISRRRHT